METEKNILKIKIGKIGNFDIEIPVIKIGNGNPKITILTGVHGDEYTGAIIIKKLIEGLEIKKGTLQLITCANPLARSFKTRATNVDLADLNRTFPGNANGTITERIAHKLTQIIGDSDLVVDLHTFDHKGKSTVILVTLGNSISEKSTEAIRAFNHERVWKIETKKEENYGQTLGAFLTRQLVPYFALETENINIAKDSDIEKTVEGLKSVLAKYQMIEGEIKEINSKLFRRIRTFSNHSGIFSPSKEPDDFVKENETIGHILDVDNMEVTEVKSTEEGFICDIAIRSFVIEGDHIFSIGKWM